MLCDRHRGRLSLSVRWEFGNGHSPTSTTLAALGQLIASTATASMSTTPIFTLVAPDLLLPANLVLAVVAPTRLPSSLTTLDLSSATSPLTYNGRQACSLSGDDLRETQAQKLNDHQGRSRAKDYDDVTQELVLRRGPQMRGELKTKVRALVEIVFGFESGQNKKHVQKNRQCAEELKDGLGFCYKESPTNVVERKGLYKAKIIQKSHPPRGVGPIFPKPAFALVLTAIECAIGEWATRIKTEIPFTSADYRSVYQEHLRCLNDFEKHIKDRADILGNILTRIHNIGRHHSGAQPIGPVVPTSVLSRSAIDAALREFQEDEETESDGENGERSD
ncbi:hypothetical protein B0H16DRAFT_1480359 [Mycena metata]|uniref:DUF6532 domain-containing protein n=1 Tax=Mycena metata TaxID=1033252 RepID=A0AAD7H3K7_9AGAR|nr:hypothetical protein B0H16DRAFT_1480359 [Mycena metata]